MAAQARFRLSQVGELGQLMETVKQLVARVGDLEQDNQVAHCADPSPNPNPR